MANLKFDEKELKVVGELPGRFGGPPTPLYDFPVSRKKAYLSAIKKDPIWQITTVETRSIMPKANPDNVARAFVVEDTMMPAEQGGGKDMFGIEWVYIPVAGGSIVKPGNPLLEDANEWEEKIVWPDIDSWDWETSAKNTHLTDEVYNNVWMQNGWFERIISFMDFPNAAMAMIDDEQKDAIKDLLDKISDLYIKIIDKHLEYFPGIDGFYMHDDWGAQKDTFFSPATVAELIVPAMRKVTDHLHSKGLVADFHSCGMIEKQVPNIIAAGWDTWSPQPMNDTHMIYEKYGDKLVIGVVPDPLPPDATEAEQREAAAKFVEKFCKPGKPATIGYSGAAVLTPAYREELYKLSRTKYSEI
ncbi:uroporphyrinogen decarboxylase (URO-D) [Oxobacter pfennigii]|uniref:Uroporphyrinogen decarboxylase (URO-D) n=1 Tax=Oxobacter pfennigii TaxID=36849 RepID=A0A0P8WT92_9CLOT|nr:uroporphyrinogen decarboxylase family protein [Oxobacter pfennigii]KPU45850.1 uroporphyrinogen decarboxylase (URO-D) [Oxobacter pfennigii]